MLRGYSNTTIYLGVGLVIAALVIFYLVYLKGSSSPPGNPKPFPRPPRPSQPPAPKSPQPNPPQGPPPGYQGPPPGHQGPPPGHQGPPPGHGGPPGHQGPPPGHQGPPPGHQGPPPGHQGPPPGHGGPPGPPQMESYAGGSGKPALVLFYNGGCGHSRNMRPAWEQAKQQLEQSGQVDCILIEDPVQMQKYGIRGFPTVKLYPNGFPGSNSVDYMGNRSAESFITFARSGGRQT